MAFSREWMTFWVMDGGMMLRRLMDGGTLTNHHGVMWINNTKTAYVGYRR
jgi:hypothetical protein